MTQPPDNDFRQRLFDAQQMNPALRDAYRQELDSLVNERHTAKSRVPAIILLVLCVGAVIGEIRALIIHAGGPTFYIGAAVMLVACSFAAAWIARDLLRGQSVRRESFQMAGLFYAAAAILTVTALMHGLAKPSDPASTFNAFYVYVFLVVCAHWAMGNRISASTLDTREHLLRLESRLADLADRMQK